MATDRQQNDFGYLSLEYLLENWAIDIIGLIYVYFLNGQTTDWYCGQLGLMIACQLDLIKKLF